MLVSYVSALLVRCWCMFITVAKLMVPVMLVVHLADQFGLVELTGEFIAPAMALLNLPPEAGIIWTTTVFTGVFGGLAAIATLAPSLQMSEAQLSAVAAMMLFSHAIPVEQAIVRQAGASFWATAALRLVTAVLYGAAVSWVCHSTGLLSEPVSFAWMTASSFASGETAATGLSAWLLSTAYSMALVFVVITVLTAALDALEHVGLIRRFTAALAPLLRLSGLHAQVAPVTTIGVLLGLTYGGALIIEAAQKQNFSPRTRFLALSWLSLSHSLIEDTLLVVALGADIWVVLVGRVIVTLLIVALLARITDRGSWSTANVGATSFER